MSDPMSNNPSTSPPERLYVDFRIQMRMLIALVILESALVCGGVGYLYLRYKAVIEENMYRIHHVPQDFFSLLLEETGWVVAFMLVLNLLGLFFADRVWGWYVKRVLGSFTALSFKVTDLDFCEDRESPEQHVVLDLMLTWRQKERRRALEIRAIMEQIETDKDQHEQLVKHLKQLRAVLPVYSRRFVGRIVS
ncbi:MAG: hypothetical protein HQL94_00970 [Magnetococcales bacterium]|nr:hypothetical protein [Magnetococcales bacterium]